MEEEHITLPSGHVIAYDPSRAEWHGEYLLIHTPIYELYEILYEPNIKISHLSQDSIPWVYSDEVCGVDSSYPRRKWFLPHYIDYARKELVVVMNSTQVQNVPEIVNYLSGKRIEPTFRELKVNK